MAATIATSNTGSAASAVWTANVLYVVSEERKPVVKTSLEWRSTSPRVLGLVDDEAECEATEDVDEQDGLNVREQPDSEKPQVRAGEAADTDQCERFESNEWVVPCHGWSGRDRQPVGTAIDAPIDHWPRHRQLGQAGPIARIEAASHRGTMSVAKLPFVSASIDGETPPTAWIGKAKGPSLDSV